MVVVIVVTSVAVFAYGFCCVSGPQLLEDYLQKTRRPLSTEPLLPHNSSVSDVYTLLTCYYGPSYPLTSAWRGLPS